ncbi:MAG: DUF86 domain-containing protein [Planctomycetota bacterium]|nr:DUF86 domain-containing protein [Planctomycetota bacterium]
MKKDDAVYLGHIMDLADKIRQRIEGKSRDDFDSNEDLRIVLTHLIQTIGEAARRVSSAFQKDHPEVPWSDIIGMRHRIVHDYMDVDEDLVWDVATFELPALVKKIEPLSPPPTP